MKLNIVRRYFFAAVLCLGLLSLGQQALSSSGSVVYVAQLTDAAINPVSAEYISKSIEAAHQDNAEALILKLDTPGGLLTTTRLIVREILDAPLPVVVYISPGGSRAGSAGVFITYAAHVAAMAPSTNIGAAHPVQMGSPSTPKMPGNLDQIIDRLKALEKDKKQEDGENADEGDEEKTSETKEEYAEPDDNPMGSKILNDTVAFIKGIAETRGRNVDWATESVTKSDSITYEEALEKGVVDIVAKDVDDLLAQLHGRTVRVQDKDVTLNTKDAQIKSVLMGVREKILGILADPNIAYLLMMLGFYGLLYEITHPGFGVPGVMGLIFLILSFYSMQTLPVNYAGIALIALGIILFIAEAIAPGIGLLALGGVLSMVLGSLMLFDSDVPMMSVSLSLIIAFTGTTAAITIFLIRSVIRSRQTKVQGGAEGLVGAKGVVKKDIVGQSQGKVFVQGALWSAQADQDLREGDKVVVESSDGLLLKVVKQEE